MLSEMKITIKEMDIRAKEKTDEENGFHLVYNRHKDTRRVVF